MNKKKRYYGTFTLGEKITSFFSNEQKKRNFYDDRILTHWNDIVQEYSTKMKPDKIVFNGINNNGITNKTLYCSTTNRQFSSEFLFYKKDILQRLNTYFGTDKSMFIDIKLKNL